MSARIGPGARRGPRVVFPLSPVLKRLRPTPIPVSGAGQGAKECDNPNEFNALPYVRVGLTAVMYTCCVRLRAPMATGEPFKKPPGNTGLNRDSQAVTLHGG